MSEPAPRVAICAIAKNEGSYFDEWVTYHHLLGFSPIRIYENESTDDSAAVLARLEAAGLAESTPWSSAPDKKPQWEAYEDGLERLRGRADWVAFIDLDEFFVLPRHDTIQDFVTAYADRDAIAVNWKMFGSSGEVERRPGLVIERFARCSKRSFRGNRAVKTLARLEAIEVPFVHTCAFAPAVRYMTIGGQELGPGLGETVEVEHDTIRLNHYFTRSREEWAKKSARGRGAKAPNDPKKHRTPAEFERHDRNEMAETDILRFIPPVKAAIAALDSTEITR